MNSNTIKTTLSIRGLELAVNLGLMEKEISKIQTVLLDVDMNFVNPPKACVSDKLEDTVCYSLLTQQLRDELKDKKFHLIEHLVHEIYHLIKSQMTMPSTLLVRVTKFPDIQGLTGGASFSFGD